MSGRDTLAATAVRLTRRLEYGGAASGMLGSFLLALALPDTIIAGWLFYLVSDVLMIAYALRQRAWGVLAMFACYGLICFLGIARNVR